MPRSNSQYSIILCDKRFMTYKRCRNNPVSLFIKQYEISIEQGCVLWGTHVIIPSRGRERVFELFHESSPGIVKIIYNECVVVPTGSEIESYVHNCGNCHAMAAVPPLASEHPWELPKMHWV